MNTPYNLPTAVDEYPPPENGFDRWFATYYPKHSDQWKTMQEYVNERPEVKESLERTDALIRKLKRGKL